MTFVKICGLTCLDDALAAAEAGADLLGFVLVAQSPRYVAPAQAAEIIAALRQRGVSTPCVGVVANRTVDEVRAIKSTCGFALMQLHGGEDPQVAAALYPDAIIARQVTGRDSLIRLATFRAFAFLLDAQGAERTATSRQTFDWQLVSQVSLPGRVIVAGGLCPENVGMAVRQAKPYGVDVSSGVERSPGHKDRDAIVRFIQAVHEADNAEDDD